MNKTLFTPLPYNAGQNRIALAKTQAEASIPTGGLVTWNWLCKRYQPGDRAVRNIYKYYVACKMTLDRKKPGTNQTNGESKFVHTQESSRHERHALLENDYRVELPSLRRTRLIPRLRIDALT
jgi:hypothetical protein